MKLWRYLRTKYDLEENDPNGFKNNKINSSNNQNTSKKLEISKKCKADKIMYLKQQKEHGFYANKAAKQYKIDKESVYFSYCLFSIIIYDCDFHTSHFLHLSEGNSTTNIN